MYKKVNTIGKGGFNDYGLSLSSGDKNQSVENLISKMDQNGIDKTALIATMWEPLPDIGEMMLKLLRLFLYKKPLRGLTKKLSSTFSPEGDIVLPKKVVKIYPDPGNEDVAKTIENFPDCFFGGFLSIPGGKQTPF